ncbi:MAG TPA: hypothetical protein VHG32_20100 [Thermoanaerobaculia bacterium]|nr:hypothetical protein [Thermoanaerobaculia bacterium]
MIKLPMPLTRSCWKALLALAPGLLALAPARAQAPLTSDLALWTDAAHPAVHPPTTACDDAGVCAAFWPVSLDAQNAQIDLMGSVVSPSGVTAPAVLRSGGFIGQPIAVGLQHGFAVFYDEINMPSGTISATVLQLLGEDLISTRPPILLPALAGRGIAYTGTSSVARTQDGFALLGQSAPGRGIYDYVSLAFVDMDGRLLRRPVQLSPPSLNNGLGLAVQPDGNLVAVYSSLTHPSRSDCSQVFVRRIASSGRLLGPAVAVANTFCFQVSPTVGVAADGTFLVAWMSRSVDFDTVLAIFAEPFSAQVRPLGKLLQVSQIGAILGPVLSVAPTGHYFVVWQGFGPSGDAANIKGRWLEADGTPITPELTLNEAQADLNQILPQVAAAINSLAVVTWQISVPPIYSDPSYTIASVARLFTTPP